ncbi:MAG: hypothetical protein H8F28_10445 [Fibrella sp.]|nr:hypothetical protein [Armatimonadota bacterium]
MTGTNQQKDGLTPGVWLMKRTLCDWRTSDPGSFAAGDVRHGSVKRFATAVGEETMTVTFIHCYLSETA